MRTTSATGFRRCSPPASTLKLSLVAFIVAAVIGLFVALMRISPRTSPRWIAISFIEVMRGTPALVILYIVYFVPPQVGLDLADLPPSPQPSAARRCRVAPFSPRSSGRESRLCIPDREAALALGMTPAKTMRYIVLPQAMRVVLPPVGNYAIGLSRTPRSAP